jgi:hypothetical protein
MTELTNMQWKRILAGGIAPHALSIGLLVVAIVAYTFLLAFGTGGEPDQGSLDQFNTVVGTQLFPIVTILLTIPAAAWAANKADPKVATMHGFAVGFLVAVIGLAFGALDLLMGVQFVITIIAGILGAKLEPAIFSR